VHCSLIAWKACIYRRDKFRAAPWLSELPIKDVPLPVAINKVVYVIAVELYHAVT
jgi:hypothetical protein